MPKLITEEDFEDEDSDEEEDDEEESQFEEDSPKKRRVNQTLVKKKIIKKEEPKTKKRFVVFAPQQVAIGDAETGEVVGQGDYIIIQTLANILERLERIEDNIGSLTS